jgi:protein CpxP
MHEKEKQIMKKRWILITVIAVSLAAATFLYAAPGGHGPRGMRGHGFGGPLGFLGHLDRVQEELGLSNEQVTQIKAILKEAHEQNEPYREQLHGEFGAVAKTLLANPNDVAAAQALVEQQSAAERALKSNFVTAASKALNVLTPEQRTKLALHLAERSQRWENRGR